jgi:hypothetical protein
MGTASNLSYGLVVLDKGPFDPAPRQDMLNAALIIIGMTLLGILAVATAVVACDGPPVERGNPGHAAAEQHVRSYVDALNANDAQRLGEFLGEPADSSDVRDRLRHLGGRDLTDIQVTVSSEFANHYRAWVKARSGGGDQVSFYEVLAWEDGRWDFAPFVTPAPSPS